MGLASRILVSLVAAAVLVGCAALWPLAARSAGDTLPVAAPARTILKGGAFLVATSKLGDTNFARSVVLLLDYGRGGAMGLIVNRPTEVDLASVYPDAKALQKWDLPVHFGGPVERGRIVFLIGGKTLPPQAASILEGVHVSGNFSSAEQRLTEDEDEHRVRVFAGYAGWAPGQLDAEVKRGDWYVMRAGADSVFSPKPDQLWERLLRAAEAIWI